MVFFFRYRKQSLGRARGETSQHARPSEYERISREAGHVDGLNGERVFQATREMHSRRRGEWRATRSFGRFPFYLFFFFAQLRLPTIFIKIPRSSILVITTKGKDPARTTVLHSSATRRKRRRRFSKGWGHVWDFSWKIMHALPRVSFVYAFRVIIIVHKACMSSTINAVSAVDLESYSSYLLLQVTVRIYQY